VREEQCNLINWCTTKVKRRRDFFFLFHIHFKGMEILLVGLLVSLPERERGFIDSMRNWNGIYYEMGKTV